MSTHAALRVDLILYQQELSSLYSFRGGVIDVGLVRTGSEGVDKDLRLLHKETFGFSPASVTITAVEKSQSNHKHQIFVLIDPI